MTACTVAVLPVPGRPDISFDSDMALATRKRNENAHKCNRRRQKLPNLPRRPTRARVHYLYKAMRQDERQHAKRAWPLYAGQGPHSLEVLNPQLPETGHHLCPRERSHDRKIHLRNKRTSVRRSPEARQVNGSTPLSQCRL